MSKVEKFVFDGHNCTLICPETAAVGKPWVWRAEFLGAFDYADKALLERGWHIAYCALQNLYGCDEAIGGMKKFHDYIVEEYGLAARADIFGFSRGGLYTTRYVMAHPEDIQTIYLDAPVLSVFSWPGGLGKSVQAEKEWSECKSYYGIDESNLAAFKQNPIDHISELVSLSIPTVLVAGGADEVVPFDENGAYLDAEMKRAGLDHITIIKPECGHHPHSLADPTPIVEFIINHH